MLKYFGISQYSIDPSSQGSTIEKIAYCSEYILKRTKNIDDSGDITYHFTILNKNFEPYRIIMNGWSLCSFTSNKAFYPSNLHIQIIDPDNKFFWNYTYTISDESRFFYIWDIGICGLNSLLELFVDVSKYTNWLEYLRTRPEVVLDEKYNQNSTSIVQKDDGITLFSDEIEKLKIENDELKVEVEKLKVENIKTKRILEKFENHIFCRLFLKRFIQI
jgi:hypothetical protein